MTPKAYENLALGTRGVATTGAVAVMAGAVAASVPLIVAAGMMIAGAALANVIARSVGPRAGPARPKGPAPVPPPAPVDSPGPVSHA